MEKKTSNMIYRNLGNSGLKVSALSWGNWINTKEEDPTYDIIKLAYDAGVNFFDTAEIYGFGEGETTIGKALKKLNVPRESLVISTKIFKVGMGVNDGFLSRKHIVEGLRNSLKRLQLDYVDVVFCHRPDPNTPLEETCRAMDFVINQGMAFYWGTSEWSASQIMDAYAVCERLNLIKPICEQPQYNLFVREKLENEYSLLFQKFKMGTTIWSPLMSGILTGKYIEGVPQGSRGDIFAENAKYHFLMYQEKKQSWDEKLLKLKALAERLGASLATLAIAWAVKNPCVSTCIVGASRADQMSENLKALDLLPKLTEEIEAEIDQILGNMPEAEMDWMTFTKKDGWRKRFINKSDEVKTKSRAVPLATKPLQKKVLELINTCSGYKKIKKGANEATKTLNRGQSELIVIAADADPLEIVLHLPLLCEDKNVPYVFIESQKTLGRACGVSRPVIAVSVLSDETNVYADQLKEVRSQIDQLANSN